MRRRPTVRRRRRLAALLVVAVAVAVGVAIARRAGRPERARWSIGIYAGPSPVDLGPVLAVPNPVLSAADVTDVRAGFVADPFLDPDGEGGWYLFFEVLNRDGLQGDIGLATSADLGHWTYQGIVLDEPFHLSYPNVFAYRGEHFMVPEADRGRAVRLYRATDYPRAWRRDATLLEGPACADPTVFRHGERWWMFTSTQTSDELHLFHAEALEGPWSEHVLSPLLVRDPDHARPAGRVVDTGRQLIRYAQDANPTYGNQVHAFEILELTTSTYRERPLGDGPVIVRTGRGWNGEGAHHVDAHPLPDGSWIAAVDGLGRPEAPSGD